MSRDLFVKTLFNVCVGAGGFVIGFEGVAWADARVHMAAALQTLLGLTTFLLFGFVGEALSGYWKTVQSLASSS